MIKMYQVLKRFCDRSSDLGHIFSTQPVYLHSKLSFYYYVSKSYSPTKRSKMYRDKKRV